MSERYEIFDEQSQIRILCPHGSISTIISGPLGTHIEDAVIGTIRQQTADLAERDARIDSLVGLVDDIVSRAERDEAELALLRGLLDEAAADPAGQYYFGLRCGVEDRDITDRYEAAEYGWQKAFEYVGSVAANATTNDEQTPVKESK